MPIFHWFLTVKITKMFSKHLLFFIGHFISVALALGILLFILPLCVTNCFSCFVYYLTVFAISSYSYGFMKRLCLTKKVDPGGRAVFITGCDTGFGHLLAKRLDSRGFHVFAGCLLPSGEGASKLQQQASKRLQVVELDVSKDESVKKASDFVKENIGSDELWAVVNNAGILKGISVEFTPIQTFQESLEVNCLGLVRVTKAFLPLLRKSKGRVVNLTSSGGRFTLPYLTPYFVSKHAASAFNDCLRTELDVWGIKVIAVEPHAFQTNLLNEDRMGKEFEAVYSTLSEDVKTDYGVEFLQKYKATGNPFSMFTSEDLSIVIDALDNAVTSKYPDIVYAPRGSVLSLIFTELHRKQSYCVQDLSVKIWNFLNKFPKPKAA